MTRIVYVNGAYKRYGEAAIHVEDRGFQFADAVYEVIEVRGGRLVDATRHLARLERSLRELAISPPMRESALLHIIGEVIRRNRVRDGIVYMQVTRGAGPREFALPGPDVLPTLVVFAAHPTATAVQTNWLKPASPSKRCPTIAGTGAISKPLCCCRQFWQRTRPAVPVRARPGLSMPPALSRRAPRAMPGL